MSINNEIEHENRLIAAGRKDLKAKQLKAADGHYTSKTQQGRHVMQMHVAELSNHLAETTSAACKTLTGRKNISQCCLEMQQLIDFLTVERIAFTTLVAMVDFHSRSDDEVLAVKLASAIGRAIEHECRSTFYQEILPEDAVASFKKRAQMPGSNAKYRRYGSQRIAERVVGKQFDEWHHEHVFRIGLYLIDVCASLGLLSCQTIRLRKRQASVVSLSALFAEIRGCEEFFLSRAFKSHPLIEEPLPWQIEDKPSRENNSGGYHLLHLRRKLFLCRDYESNTRLGEKALELLNCLQRTAWRIDLRVLEIAEHCQSNHISVGKKFVVTPFDRPVKGGAPQHVAEIPKLLKEWKEQRSHEHKLYTEMERKSRRTAAVIYLAQQYKHKTFYLSWSCDWRGRMYPQQPWLQSQGPDYERALLKFRDGCQLTEDGKYWVKAAIGAAYNGSRISHQQRIQWTENNQDLLQRIAQDPIRMICQWEQAKDPWQFLQLCFEWNDVVIQQTEKFWKVPIGCDSTASGFQLLSGMRRDPEGMKYANLLPPEEANSPPQDAYQRVLERARELASAEPELSYLTKYLGFRDVGKAALMVAIYGAKSGTIKERIKDALRKEGRKLDANDASLLQKLIVTASKEVFPAAFEALSWLEKLAKCAHKNGAESLSWQTPTGDSIHLYKYSLNDTKKVYLSDGSTISIADWDDHRPDPKQQVSSFAPSFIHSFDAALCKEAFTDWKHPLALIHDCIRVLPNDMDRANDRIRDAFTAVVSGDPLSSLADDLGVTAGQHARLKQLGGNLGDVLKSMYMFN